MAFSFTPLSADTRIFIAGHRGLVGSALWRHFENCGFVNLIGRSSDELDLRNADATTEFFRKARPQVVICAAARVGGIGANAGRPAEYISDNLRIQVNLLDGAVAGGVERLLFLGSSCIYPKFAAQPIREDALMTGPLEVTNEAYATAKIAGIAHVAAIRRQHHLPYITAMPTSLYGPGDNFDPDDSHVVPALIRRFHEATLDGVAAVHCWGSGRPQRDLLHVDDCAKAIHTVLDSYEADQPINIGSGREVSIAVLADLIASVVGYQGEIIWDTSKPDGTPRKLLDTQLLDGLGWKPEISIEQGIQTMYEWFLAHGGGGQC